VTLPGGAPSPLRDLPASLGLTFDTPICSGLEAIGTCRATDAGRDVVGVAVTSFDAASKQITALRLLWEAADTGA
jgi:hypothetical protein